MTHLTDADTDTLRHPTTLQVCLRWVAVTLLCLVFATVETDAGLAACMLLLSIACYTVAAVGGPALRALAGRVLSRLR